MGIWLERLLELKLSDRLQSPQGLMWKSLVPTILHLEKGIFLRTQSKDLINLVFTLNIFNVEKQ